MVCNIKATREELAVADKAIQDLAQKVTGYKVEVAKMGEVSPADTRFDAMLSDVKGVAAEIGEQVVAARKRSYDHMSEHATAWALAGFPEGSEDQESVIAQEEIREAYSQRLETLYGMVNDLESRRPKVIVQEEQVEETIGVDQAQAILKALGRA
jgi:hypothetical protein